MTIESLIEREQLFYERVASFLRSFGRGVDVDTEPVLRVLLELWSQSYAELWEHLSPLERKARLMAQTSLHEELLERKETK